MGCFGVSSSTRTATGGGGLVRSSIPYRPSRNSTVWGHMTDSTSGGSGRDAEEMLAAVSMLLSETSLAEAVMDGVGCGARVARGGAGGRAAPDDDGTINCLATTGGVTTAGPGACPRAVPPGASDAGGSRMGGGSGRSGGGALIATILPPAVDMLPESLTILSGWFVFGGEAVSALPLDRIERIFCNDGMGGMA
mmetsp:Transcript_48414/g.89797  ORF Transcript_48414/g.89797 Transcript_48414/m.89797 type:complete len:194 (+) Transcript_48414:310-891(+)